MASREDWSFVAEVLRTGPADGHEILDHAQGNQIWEALYTASRSSGYSAYWRQLFGRQRASDTLGVRSVLELAVLELRDQVEGPLDQGNNAQIAIFTAKFIANCCVDNDHNRRISIKAGVLLPFMNLLLKGADPNILIPAIYNVCADLEDPAENVTIDPAAAESGIQPTLAEERLATTDGSAKSIFSGIFVFLSPPVVLGCSDEIKEYLADIIEMAARPSAVVDYVNQTALSNALDRLLALDGGRLLAEHSVKCRISIIRAVLAIAVSSTAKSYLASSGAIFDVAFITEFQNVREGYWGDGKEEQRENSEAIKASRQLC